MLLFLMLRLPPKSALFPYTTLFRSLRRGRHPVPVHRTVRCPHLAPRSEEHTSELQSRGQLVCRLLLEKKNKTTSVCHTAIRAADEWTVTNEEHAQISSPRKGLRSKL